MVFGNSNLQIRVNGETQVDRFFSVAAPITIIGAPNIGTEVSVEVIGDNPVMAGGVVVQGSNSKNDVLTIRDGLSDVVVHTMTELGDGNFEIDGASISYSAFESVSEKIAPTITELGTIMQKATSISLGSIVSPIYDSGSLTYAWSITSEGDLVTTSSLPTIEFLPPPIALFTKSNWLSPRPNLERWGHITSHWRCRTSTPDCQW